MRIAVYHDLPSGGAKRTLYESVRRLAQRHQVDVFTLESADHIFGDLRPYVAQHRVYPFAPLRLLQSPFGRANQAIRIADLRRLNGLGREVARDILVGGYDVAFINPCRFENAPSVLRHLESVPSVYYCQEPPRLLYESIPARPYDDSQSRRRRMLNHVDPMLKLYRSILARVDRRNVLNADRVLANSRFMRDVVNSIYGIDARVSYLGVDTEWTQPRKLDKEAFVLSVGSLTPLKGFDFLIEALASIPAERRPPLTIASNFQNPPERAYLEALARERGVALNLAGNVSDEALVTLYSRARLVAYAPVREPFGLVALEAMACGTPVVAVAEGGILETVLHEHTGLLTEREPTAFAEALMRLYENPVLAETYGRNGRECVLRRWSWVQAAETLETHLMTTVAEHSLRRTNGAVAPPGPRTDETKLGADLS